MAAGSIRAGMAYVTASFDQTKFGKQLTEAENKLRKFGASVTTIGLKTGLAGAAIFGSFLPAIKAASDMTETLSKFDVVFGSARASMRAWVSETANAFGRSNKDIAEFSSTLKAFLSAFEEIDPSKANEMSKTIAKLAVDFGSFYNLPDEEAFTKIISGLSGEIEPLRRLGIIVNESTVAAQLALDGIDYQKASESQKVLGRYAVILKTSTVAQGDAVRTAGQFANTFKRLKSEVYDAAAALGKAMQPALTVVLKVAADAASKISDFAAANQTLTATVGLTGLGLSVLAVGLGATLVAVGQVVEGIANLVKVTKLLNNAGAIKGVLSLGNAILSINTASAVASLQNMALWLRNVNLAALAANARLLLTAPAMLAVGAAAGIAAGVGLLYFLSKIGEYTKDYIVTADKHTEKVREQNEATSTYLGTLETLSKKQELSAAEQKSAEEAISALGKSYGDLGIYINGATGQLLGFDKAQAKVTTSARENTIAALNAEIRDRKNKVANTRKLLDSLTTQGEFEQTGTNIVTLGTANKLRYGFSGDDKVAEYSKQIDEESAKLVLLARELGKLKAGANPVDPKQSQAAQLQRRKTIDDGLDASLDLEKQREEERRRLLSDEEQQIAAVNDRRKEQLALVQKIRDAEAVKGNAYANVNADKSRSDLDSNADQQIAEIRRKAQESYDKKLATLKSEVDTKGEGEESREVQNVNDDLKEQMALLDEIAQREAARRNPAGIAEVESLRKTVIENAERDIAGVRDRWHKRRLNQEKELADAQQARADAADDRREFNLEQSQKLAESVGNSEQAKYLKKALRDLQFERQLDRIYGDDENSKAAARRIQAKINDLADGPKFASRGIYQANQLQSLRGGGSIQEKIADNTKETAKNTAKIARQTPRNLRWG